MRHLFFLIPFLFGLAVSSAQAQIGDNPYRIYIAIEGGWQSVEYDKLRYISPNLRLRDELTSRPRTFRPLGVFSIDGPKQDGVFIAAGGIGVERKFQGVQFLFLPSRLYTGAEVNFGYSSFRAEMLNTYKPLDSAGDEEDDEEITDAVRVEESLAISAAADLGFYIFWDILLFSRIGYAYVDSQQDVHEVFSRETDSVSGTITLSIAQYAESESEHHAFIIGGGLRYQLSDRVGARFYYLSHHGGREAHDVRFGFVWRVF